MDHASSYQNFCTQSSEQALIQSYVEAFDNTPEQAKKSIHTLKERKIFEKEIQQIIEHFKGIKSSSFTCPIYARVCYFPHLPRNIESFYHLGGPVYLPFHNVISKGDPLSGQGISKKAKLALDLRTGEVVARVTYAWTTANKKRTSEEIAREARVARLLKNREGIVQFYSSEPLKYPSSGSQKNFTTKNAKKPLPSEINKARFIQKFYNGGTAEAALSNDPTINKKGYPFPSEKELLLIAKGVLKGLQALQEIKFIHRDMKPSNLLLMRDPKTNEITDCVINDFCNACPLDDTIDRLGMPGTPLYMAPEYLAAFSEETKGDNAVKASDFPCDNWGAGLILYELFKNTIPEWDSLPGKPFWFGDQVLEELADHLNSLARESEWEKRFPKPVDEHSIGHVIRGLLAYDPANRISIDQAIEKVIKIIELKNLKLVLA